MLSIISPISIHTSLTGSDTSESERSSFVTGFQSTLPSREVTDIDRKRGGQNRFQSTLPSREVTTTTEEKADPWKISIHTSLTGSDYFINKIAANLKISIHTSLTGSDKSI